MTQEATFQINMPVSPAEFQYLYRLIVCDFHDDPPTELVQRLYNIRQALLQPIIELKANKDGEVSEEAHRDNRVSNELARGHARAGAN